MNASVQMPIIWFDVDVYYIIQLKLLSCLQLFCYDCIH